MVLQMEPSPADIGITEATVTAVKMDMKADITYSNYDKKVSIQLPAAAGTATEIPWR
jgi:hypothetical protein